MKRVVRSTLFHLFSLCLTALRHVDLDSVASALGYAWVHSHTSGKAIAYITTPREDFVLRAENLHALGLAGITQPFEVLYCSGDPMPSQVSQFALVDHNVLNTRYASPTTRVVAVIDHHEDEGRYMHTADPRIIEPAGSCASLVARLSQSSHLAMPQELSTLLLSAILIDTKGLKAGGKALDVDREAAAFLLPLSHLTCGEECSTLPEITHLSSVQSLSVALEEKKSDVSHLSTRDLLRRDYKEYAFRLPASDHVITAGLATVPLRLSNFFTSSKSPVKEIRDWIVERDISVLGVLTTFRSKKGKGKREQLWIIKAGDEGIAEKLWRGLESNEELAMKRLAFAKLGSVDNTDTEDSEEQEVITDEAVFGKSYIARAYKQGNASATRKQTAPILRRILEGT